MPIVVPRWSRGGGARSLEFAKWRSQWAHGEPLRGLSIFALIYLRPRSGSFAGTHSRCYRDYSARAVDKGQSPKAVM
jgi:hypothetical protein